MEVICLETEAFYKLVDNVVTRIKKDTGLKADEWKWIPEEEAMAKLNISSKTTLQKLRDNGEIRFTQPRKKIILYDRDSIAAYLEKHAQDLF